mmetsp:Transcript_13790/g.26294  ORF Transcript_13790/g.26294 Transcript_13790/m.26294 type:complete len:244 (+) Transcript_13790:238-969(+)
MQHLSHRALLSLCCIAGTLTNKLGKDIDIDDLDVLVGFLVCGVHALDRLEHIHAFRQPPEDRVLVVEPWTRNRSDEKLRPIRVRPRVRHAQHPRTVVAQVAMELVFEFTPPDALSTGTVSEGVTSLHHEILDHAVEDGLVVVAILRVRHEVLHRLRALLREEHERHVAHGGVHHGYAAHLGRLVGHHVGELLHRLLVEDVAVFLSRLTPREPVEPLLLIRAREDARVLQLKMRALRVQCVATS